MLMLLMAGKVVICDKYSSDGDNSDFSEVDDTKGVDRNGGVDANRDDGNRKYDCRNNRDDADDSNNDVGNVDDDGGVEPNIRNDSVMAK